MKRRQPTVAELVGRLITDDRFCRADPADRDRIATELLANDREQLVGGPNAD